MEVLIIKIIEQIHQFFEQFELLSSLNATLDGILQTLDQIRSQNQERVVNCVANIDNFFIERVTSHGITVFVGHFCN